LIFGGDRTQKEAIKQRGKSKIKRLKNSYVKRGKEKKMTNQKVINLFLEKRQGKTPTRFINDGIYYYKGNTLKTDGKTLINYNTIIAEWKNDYIIVNMRKYSRTTSKIQGQLLFEIEQRKIDYIKDGIRG